MECPSLVLFLGVSFFYWTTATPLHTKSYLLEIDHNVLRNVTLLLNTSSIELIGLGLTGIVENAFDTVSHIKTLDLSNNSIERFPPNVFSKLMNLEELSLAHNKFQSYQFNKTFVGLISLKHLNLSCNDISFLDSNSFIGLPNSAEVIIERSGFSTFNLIEYTIWRKLVRRSATFNEKAGTSKIQLCMVNGTVNFLSNFEKGRARAIDCLTRHVKRKKDVINFSKLNLTRFSRNWYKLAAHDIRKLDFSSNMIEDITPELLNDLPQSLAIDLSDTGISRIRANVMQNEHCISLHFGGKSLQEIEDHALEKLCLIELIIDNSNLNNLDFIRTLPIMIKYLTVSNNNITEISPNLFQNLHELKMIDLSNNKFKKIEGNVFSGLVNGLDIFLDHNDIDFIAEGSFNNVDLYYLSLNYNKITEKSIHKGAFNFSNIEILKLMHNSIMTFDEELFSGILEKCLINFDANPITRIINLNYRKRIS